MFAIFLLVNYLSYANFCVAVFTASIFTTKKNALLFIIGVIMFYISISLYFEYEFYQLGVNIFLTFLSPIYGFNASIDSFF